MNETATTKREQKTLNRVWAHFITSRALPGWDNEINRCSYRGSNGGKCAVGVLLTDEEAALLEQRRNEKDIRLGSGTIAHVLSELSVLGKKLPSLEGLSVLFLTDLQTAHDLAADHAHAVQGGYNGTKFRRRLKKELARLSDKYKLTLPGK